MTARRKPYDAVKRLLDIIGALILLVITAPIQLVVAVLVAIKLGRPVLFKQHRPGKDEKIFSLMKFRTMRNVDEAKGLVTNEDRMTRFGSHLRNWSLDELPSLWNVLKGDISLVGPRPLLVKYLSHYSAEQARRHEVRPGLTGLAQVNGRNALEWDTRFHLDVEYVDSYSFVLDFQILLKTVVKVAKKEGIATKGHVVGAPFVINENPRDKAT